MPFLTDELCNKHYGQQHRLRTNEGKSYLLSPCLYVRTTHPNHPLLVRVIQARWTCKHNDKHCPETRSPSCSFPFPKPFHLYVLLHSRFFHRCLPRFANLQPLTINFGPAHHNPLLSLPDVILLCPCICRSSRI